MNAGGAISARLEARQKGGKFHVADDNVKNFAAAQGKIVSKQRNLSRHGRCVFITTSWAERNTRSTAPLDNPQKLFR